MAELDQIDMTIIELLRKDARASFTSIGDAVGLSSTAVKRRVDQLVEAEVIQGFTIVTGRDVSGDNIQAFLEVYCRGTVSPEKLVNVLKDIPEVKAACTITGQADALVHMVAATVPQLEKAIEQVRTAKHVDHSVTAIMLSPLIDRW